MQLASMNTLSTLLEPGNTLLDLDAPTKLVLFEKMGQFFAQRYHLAASAIVDNLLAREALGSTGLGKGVAVPHGRIHGLNEPRVAFVRVATPLIDFDAPDGLPVRLFFFLLVPEQVTKDHLEILSEIAQLLSDQSMRDALQADVSSDAVHALLIR